MQVSSRFTIAVHLFVCIDTFQGAHALTSDFLAGSVNANPVVIRRILGQLKAAGLVQIVRGGSGGAALSRPLEEITLLDVFNAVEALDGGTLFHFHENPSTRCPVGRNIHRGLDGHLMAAQQALEESLRAVTLAQVVHDTQQYFDASEVLP